MLHACAHILIHPSLSPAVCVGMTVSHFADVPSCRRFDPIFHNTIPYIYWNTLIKWTLNILLKVYMDQTGDRVNRLSAATLFFSVFYYRFA